MEITPEQREKLLQILDDLKEIDNDVENAYNTGLIVDAKESIRYLCSKIDKDEILDSKTRQQLSEYLLAARIAISPGGGTSTKERAVGCIDKLLTVKSYLRKLLE